MADEERRELRTKDQMFRSFFSAAGVAILAIAALAIHAWLTALLAVIGAAVFIAFGVRARRRLMRGDS